MKIKKYLSAMLSICILFANISMAIADSIDDIDLQSADIDYSFNEDMTLFVGDGYEENLCDINDVELSQEVFSDSYSEDTKQSIADIPIIETNFPNHDFRNIILSECDSNKDGYLSQEEIEDVTTLSLSGFVYIDSLKGIEFFTGLSILECDNTGINGNGLKSLDLSCCQNLISLCCRGCGLTNLNVSNCSKLKSLYCYGNNLTDLDLSGCPLLKKYISSKYYGEYSPVGKKESDTDYWDSKEFIYYFEDYEPGYGGIAFDKGVNLIINNTSPTKKLYQLKGTPTIQSLKRIESESFSNSGLTSIKLSNSVEYIADNAFDGSKINTIYAVKNSYAWKWALAHGFVERNATSIEDLLDKSHSKTNSNGDVLYQPSDSDLRVNSHDGSYVIFYDNILIVYLDDPATVEEVQTMLDLLGGTLVGFDYLKTMLQIKVPSSDLSDLDSFTGLIIQDKNVVSTDYYPYMIKPEIEASGIANMLDSNPWKNEGIDRANELLPDGNDWWAEAIGAYTAWRYDSYAKSIKVGVIDSDIDDSNTDLKDKVIKLSEPYDSNKIGHGTGVSGIIAASNNSKLIRGIADKAKIVYCHDNEDCATDISKLVNYGATIINMSVGYSYFSEKGFRDAIDKHYESEIRKWYKAFTASAEYIWYNLTFQEQLDAANHQVDVCAKFTQEFILHQMIYLLNNKKDFLLIESAGNGYDNADTYGLGSVKYTRKLPINESVFNDYSDNYRSKLAKRGITFQSIRDRIIIVGSIIQPTSRNNYFLDPGTNYGQDVDIVAPGVNIYTLSKGSQGDQTSDGTSFTAPMVTGAAALLNSIDPNLSKPEIKKILIDTGSKVMATRYGKSKKYPLLNVGRAVESRLEHIIELSGYLCECLSESADEIGLITKYKTENYSDYAETSFIYTNGTVWCVSEYEDDAFDGAIVELYIDGDSDEGNPQDKNKYSIFHLTVGMNKDELEYFMEKYSYTITTLSVVDMYEFTISKIYGFDVYFQVGVLGDKIWWMRYTCHKHQ